jgi:hypothetical protein
LNSYDIKQLKILRSAISTGPQSYTSADLYLFGIGSLQAYVSVSLSTATEDVSAFEMFQI